MVGFSAILEKSLYFPVSCDDRVPVSLFAKTLIVAEAIIWNSDPWLTNIGNASTDSSTTLFKQPALLEHKHRLG